MLPSSSKAALLFATPALDVSILTWLWSMYGTGLCCEYHRSIILLLILCITVVLSGSTFPLLLIRPAPSTVCLRRTIAPMVQYTSDIRVMNWMAFPATSTQNHMFLCRFSSAVLGQGVHWAVSLADVQLSATYSFGCFSKN